MKKIITVSALVLLAIGLGFVICPKKDTRKAIAVVTTLSHPALENVREGFVESLKQFDPNIIIKEYNAEGNVQQANLIAEKLATDNEIVSIFAIGTLAAQTVSKATKSKPILFAAVSDTKNIAPNLPDNVCGLTDALDADFQIETIQKLFPWIASISLLYSPHEANSSSVVKKLQTALKKRQITTELVGVLDTQSIMPASQEACKKAQAILIPLDNQLAAAMPTVIKATKSMPCPVIASDALLIRQGATLAFGIDYKKIGENAGALMSEIFSGTKTPKSIGAIDPINVTLYVNRQVLKEKHLTINEQNGIQLIEGESEGSHE